MTKWLPAAVALVTFAAFSPSIAGGFVNWDDDRNVERNERLHAKDVAWMLTAFHEGHWHPLTWLSFALDHAIWGLRPAGYHLTNVVLHAASAAAAYFLIVALLAAAGGADGPALRWSSAAGAVFWAVHPLRVETVAWVTERRGVLGGLLLVLAVLAYLRAARGGGWKWHAAALGCFALSLTSKTVAMTLPVVLVVLDAWPLKRLTRRTLVEKLPYAVLAAAAAVLALGAVDESGAGAALSRHGVVERLAQAAYGLCFYVVRTVAPANLSPLYLVGWPLDPKEPRFIAAALTVAGVVAALVAKRRRVPGVVAAAAAYAVLLSPVLGLTQSGMQLVADRYSYVSCLAWAALAAWGLSRIAARPAIAAAAIVLLGLGAATVVQVRRWRDSTTLWSHAIVCDPSNYVAYQQRGLARKAVGDRSGALADLDAAIRIEPRWTQAIVSRGRLHAEEGRIAEALRDLDECVRRGPTPEVLTFRAQAWERRDASRARADYDEALRRDPAYAPALLNRGVLRASTGDVRGAVGDFDAALRAQPGWAMAHANRGVARAQIGDLAGALADFDAAIRQRPGVAEYHVFRGIARRDSGDRARAIADFETALRLDPRHADARRFLDELRR